MVKTERLSITISVVALGLALSVLVPLPVRELYFVVLGSELTIHLSGAAQMAAIIVAIVCAGIESIIRLHPQAALRPISYTATYWALPSILTVASLILVQQAEWWGHQVLMLAVGSTLIALVVSLQYSSIDSPGAERLPGGLGAIDLWQQPMARSVLNAIGYGTALILFITLYGTRARSVVSATSVMMASGLLSLGLLRSERIHVGRTWLYAGILALIMGELTWALNYAGLPLQVGGGFLLLTFYVLSSLIQQYLWKRLNRRVLAEYGTVYAVGVMSLVAISVLTVR